MSLSASQKFAVLCLPVGAASLGILTAGPEWNPKREARYWRDRMHPAKAVELAVAPVPAEGEKPAEPKPAEGAGVKPKPGPKPAPPKPAEGTKPAEPKPVEKKPTEPAPPPPPAEPKGLEYRIPGLAIAKTSSILEVPASLRLDLKVTGSGAIQIKSDIGDVESVVPEIRSGGPESKSQGLFWVLPHAKAPWEPVKQLLALAAEHGWQNIACGVAAAGDPGQGRVLRIDVPATEAPTTKGLDTLSVGVTGLMNPAWTVNGEACATLEALSKKVAALHKEYEEGFEEGYSAVADETPWVIDGSGSSAGGVLQALDALRAAGVKTVRIAGVVRK